MRQHNEGEEEEEEEQASGRPLSMGLCACCLATAVLQVTDQELGSEKRELGLSLTCHMPQTKGWGQAPLATRLTTRTENVGGGEVGYLAT